MPFRLKLPLPVVDLDLRLIRGSTGPPDSAPKRHLDGFNSFWETVYKTVRPYQTVVCPVCLSVSPV